MTSASAFTTASTIFAKSITVPPYSTLNVIRLSRKGGGAAEAVGPAANAGTSSADARSAAIVREAVRRAIARR